MNKLTTNIPLLVVASFLIIAGCNLFSTTKYGLDLNGKWQNEGLNEFFVYEIQLHEGLVYAGTNKGIFRKEVQGQNWEYLGPVHKDSALIPAFVIFSSDEILASTYFGRNRDSDAPTIARTINGGETWERLEVGNNAAPVYGALIHPTQKEHIVIGLSSGFSKHSGIRKSSDDGQSWSTTFSKDGWGILALEKSPRDGSIIYASGYNHSDFKQRTVWFAASSDFGDTWQVVSNLKNPTSTNVRDLAILQMGESEIIYMATNSGVYSYTIPDLNQ